MDILTIAFLVGVGVIAGIIAAIVGGAAVVIYPALIATGVPPHLAAVSNLRRSCRVRCWPRCRIVRNCRRLTVLSSV
jgi:hypothetical protein